MNKFLQNITSLVAIVLFLIMGACNNHPQAPILLEVEKIIEEQPDSALSILNKVENINQLSEKDHATYCLLLTQAQDLNYITHTSDSLIKIAATYLRKVTINTRQVFHIITWDVSIPIYTMHSKHKNFI